MPGSTYRARYVPGLLVAAALAAPACAATFVVDSAIDAVDEGPGDGICRTAAGACTLRAAVQEANALAGPDAIEVPAGLYVLTLGPDSGFTDARDGDLDVTDDLTITGASADTTIVDGGARFGIFERVLDAALDVERLTLRNGVGVEGGAISSLGDKARG